MVESWLGEGRLVKAMIPLNHWSTVTRRLTNLHYGYQISNHEQLGLVDPKIIQSDHNDSIMMVSQLINWWIHGFYSGWWCFKQVNWCFMMIDNRFTGGWEGGWLRAVAMASYRLQWPGTSHGSHGWWWFIGSGWLGEWLGAVKNPQISRPKNEQWPWIVALMTVVMISCAGDGMELQV